MIAYFSRTEFGYKRHGKGFTTGLIVILFLFGLKMQQAEEITNVNSISVNRLIFGLLSYNISCNQEACITIRGTSKSAQF